MDPLIWADPAEDADTAEALLGVFREAYGHDPRGVWAAPGRVNLIGEHTDYNDGWCLPFALQHSTYAAMSPRDDGRLRLRSLQQEGHGWEGPVDVVRRGEPEGWPSYVVGVAAVLAERAGAGAMGADVLVDGHVPLGAGLSSSAALSCSVGVAWRDLVPALADLTNAGLAAACVRAENEVAGAATGGMDQNVSLRAEDGHAALIDCRELSLVPIPWTLPDREILVIDTQAHHSLADGQYAARRATCERAAQALGVRSLRDLDAERLGDNDVLTVLSTVPDGLRRVRHVLTENDRVLDLVAALRGPDPARAGRLMTTSHVSLHDDYEVSSIELDVAVAAALGAGADGARMTGGGFGGSAIALVRRAEVAPVARAVAQAFSSQDLGAPHFLTAVPSAPARRVR